MRAGHGASKSVCNHLIAFQLRSVTFSQYLLAFKCIRLGSPDRKPRPIRRPRSAKVKRPSPLGGNPVADARRRRAQAALRIIPAWIYESLVFPCLLPSARRPCCCRWASAAVPRAGGAAPERRHSRGAGNARSEWSASSGRPRGDSGWQRLATGRVTGQSFCKFAQRPRCHAGGHTNHFQGQFFQHEPDDAPGFGRLVWHGASLDEGLSLREVLPLGESSLCTLLPRSCRASASPSNCPAPPCGNWARSILHLHIPPEAVHIMPVRTGCGLCPGYFD